MCGIAGYWNHNQDGSRAVAGLHQALKAMLSRGPDQQGILAYSGDATQPSRLRLGEQPMGNGVRGAVGACRLSIQDLSSAGNQPLLAPDGRLALAYNGEIYNFRELRQELSQEGYRFLSHSDAEVVLAAYQFWGEDCLKRFVGMFALAIVDMRARKLWLARDFFGMKPLYYSQHSGFSFASQMGPLLELSKASRDVDPVRLQQYLESGHVDDGDRTLFQQIRALPPAHTLTVSLDDPKQIQIRRYWSLDSGSPLDISIPEAAAHLREMFLRSVQLHMRSDVPVVSALSGGVDSSSIVAAMRLAVGPSEPIHTFTLVDGSGKTSEEPFARLVSEHCNTNMHVIQLRPLELPDRFQDLVRAHDQPFSSPVVFAQYQVFEAVHAAGFKVMLSGQGPDEFLAGYHISIAHRIASLARKGRFLSASLLLRKATQGGEVRTQDLLRPALGLALPGGLRDRIRSLRRERLPARWLNAAWFEKRIPHVSPRSAPSRNGVFHSMLLRGMEHAPLPLMLRVEDRNSMAFSVENRLPFLTPEIVQFALSLPEHHLISSSGTTKHVFRQAMQGITPQAVLDRRDKMAFPVPVSSWLDGVRPWAERTLESLEGVAPLNYPTIRQMLQNFRPGQTEFVPQAFVLWRLIFLAGWAQNFNARFD